MAGLLARFGRALGLATGGADAPAVAQPAAVGGVVAAGESATGPQLPGGAYSGGGSGESELSNWTPAPLSHYRKMRRHPTLAIGRVMRTAPVVDNEWSYEQTPDAPEGAAEFIRAQMTPLRTELVRSSAFALLDFGWAAYEKVFAVTPDGMLGIRKLKALLHDVTTLLISSRTGALVGVRNGAAPPVNLPIDYALVMYRNVEGTNWYGNADLENARLPYQWWTECNNGAARYDKLQAGSHWVLQYPAGRSALAPGGPLYDNGKIAADMLNGLQAAGSITIPKLKPDGTRGDDGALSQWEVDLLSDSTPRQSSFTERLKYLDALLLRALLVPERAATEGQFGTKAEAESHADSALKNIAQDDRDIAQFANWYVVDQLLAANWGDAARGTVRIIPAPLADEKLAFYREALRLAFGNPSGFIELFNVADWDSMAEKVGLPLRESANEGLLGADVPAPFD